MHRALTNAASVPTAETTFSEADDRATGPNGTPVQVLRDWEWMYQQEAAGAFEEYRGQLIAVHNKTILAVDRNAKQLEAAVQNHVAWHLGLVVIRYVDNGEVLGDYSDLLT